MVAGLLVGCGGKSKPPADPSVIKVPSDHSTIQAAVDAAQPGDLVLIGPGSYREEVNVDTAGITIRGTDRNEVQLDGDHDLANGIQVTSSGVSVENLIAKNYLYNGVIFNGVSEAYDQPDLEGPTVDGFRVSHVTTYNNGLYGIYAFGSTNGTIVSSYASGHPDSGIYIGQCKPCDTVVDDVTAENNAIGYYGTNASGGVFVVNSRFRGNRLGITPNSQDTELLPPQAETVVAGNMVSGEGAELAPAIPEGFYGGGIAIGGGTRNTIVRNRVEAHPAYGIGLVALGPYEPESNTVTDNVVSDNLIDLYYAPARNDEAVENCFAGNEFETSAPDKIEQLMPCDQAAAAPLLLTPVDLPDAPPDVDYQSLPEPPDQPTMPDPTSMPSGPAGAPTVPALDAIQVPEPV
jgi:hypothetical protein